MKETIIVTLTTWTKRIHNIPKVLDSIYAQSLPADYVVLNLAFDEVIPLEVDKYIHMHSVIINRVPDTKVYKKLLPTLKMFRDACVINIDDDWLYPRNMIEEFMATHKRYPNNPITGNYICFKHLNCHCGCASLTKYSFFDKWLDLVDDETILNCPSDDIVFTYLAARNGRYYIRTQNTYFLNMEPINNENSYSSRLFQPEKKSLSYLEDRFGRIKYTNPFGFLKVFFITRFCGNHNLFRDFAKRA